MRTRLPTTTGQDVLCLIQHSLTSFFCPAKAPFISSRLRTGGWRLNVLFLLMASSSSWAQCYQPAINYGVGAGPRSVAVGDVNGDGRPDIITANQGNASVSILLGLSEGALGAATNYPTTYVPFSVAVGDVNGDGLLDVITSTQSSRVAVLLGRGDGSFMAPVIYLTGGPNPLGLAVSDVNGDGRPDIITANQGNASVSVLLGNGNGTFGAATNYPVSAGGYALAVSDINGDGLADIICANSNIANVSVLLGLSGGGFAPVNNYSVGTNPQSVVVGDVNGDGRPDIIVANLASNNVSVLLGLSGGGFAPRANYAAGVTPQSVAVGDVNGDSRLDIITANVSTNSVSVLLGQSGGGFAAPASYPTGTSPFSVAVGDLNGDGQLEIITANVNSNDASLLVHEGFTSGPVAGSTVVAGAAVTATVSASGTGSFTYQWYKTNLSSPVAGQTSETLSLTGVTLADAGSYSAVVTGDCGRVTSTAFNLVVTQPIRYVKAGGSGDGTSWATASGDLQAMINAEGVEQVWVAQGTYTPTTMTDRTISFTLRNGVSILGGFPGNGDPGLTQRSPASYTTILSGDIDGDGTLANNSIHVINNPPGLTQTAVLDGVVITGGNANGGSGITTYGGGMYNVSGSPTVRHCVFQGNYAFTGGGMYNDFGSSPSLTNCIFQANTTSGEGGGLYNKDSNPSLFNCIFQANTVSYNGGGVYNMSSSPSLLNCSFLNNKANLGGGMYNKDSSPSLLNCSFLNNKADLGGVVYNFSSSPSLANCVVFGNDRANTFVNVNGVTMTARFSLFEVGVTGYIDGGNNRTTTMSPFISATDPRLAPGSPAINTGDNAAYTAAGGPPTDLAGNVRIQNGTIDMGAYEFSLPTDLIPLLYVTPSLAYSTTTGSVVVDVFEINSAPTSGTITVHITKSPQLSLSFDPGATNFLGHPVQNSGWTFDATSSSNAYILTTTQVIGAGSKLSVGLSSLLTPGQTKGLVSVTATLVGTSGGEVTVTNNTDADKLEYFSK